MNLLNNWLIQAIIGNIVWFILCKIVKWFRNNSKKQKVEIIKDKSYSKSLIQKQFHICFWVSSCLSILIIIILINHLQNKIPTLFLFFVIINFWCYILMLGAFDVSLDYVPNDKLKPKQ